MALESRETGNLIGSDKVEGTAVYGADSEKIGSIERVMIDKISGRVSYAVLSFGGFLGIGDDHYPLPWQSLKYDTNLEGYITGITLKAARRRAQIRQRQQLELGGYVPHPRGERLLRRSVRRLAIRRTFTNAKAPAVGRGFFVAVDHAGVTPPSSGNFPHRSGTMRRRRPCCRSARSPRRIRRRSRRTRGRCACGAGS